MGNEQSGAKHKIQVLGFNPGCIKTNLMTEFDDTDPKIVEFRAEFTKHCPAGDMWIPLEQVINTMLFLTSGMTRSMIGAGLTLDAGYLAS